MNINTTIQKHQDAITAVVNRAGAELPPKIVQLILQNVLFQVDVQTSMAIQRENTKKGDKNEHNERKD